MAAGGSTAKCITIVQSPVWDTGTTVKYHFHK